MRAHHGRRIGTIGAGALVVLLGLQVPVAHAETSDTVSICDAFGAENQTSGTCANNDEDPQTYELGSVEWTYEDDGSMSFHVSSNEYTRWSRFGVCIPFTADIGSESEWFRCDPTDPSGEALTEGVTSSGPAFSSAGDGWYSFGECTDDFTFVVDAAHVPDTGDFRFAISIDEAPEDTDDLPPATPSDGCNVDSDHDGQLPQYQYEAFGRVQPQAAPAQPTTTTTTAPAAVGGEMATRPQQLPVTGSGVRTLSLLAAALLAVGGTSLLAGRSTHDPE